MADQFEKRLSVQQLEGSSCVVCGERFRPMVPLDVETRLSAQVFRCDRSECQVESEDVRRWVAAG